MCKFSIIIPVYNVELYLHRCLDSICTQVLEDWECILVDDGSTDKSGDICDEYMRKGDRIRVIHKVNGGVSSARNRGIEESCGEWLVFVDADDFVTDDYLSSMVLHTDCDYIITGHTEILKDGDVNRAISDIDKKFERQDLRKLLSQYLYTIQFVTPWAKAFKRSLIEQNAIRYNEAMVMSEDGMFSFTYLMYCRSIYVLHDAKYKYTLYKGEDENRFRWAMDAEKMLYHIDIISRGYTDLCNKLVFTCDTYVSATAFAFVRCYCRYLERDKKCFTEPLKNIKAVLTHPFIKQGMFGKPQNIFSKDGLYYYAFVFISALGLYRPLLYVIMRFYMK